MHKRTFLKRIVTGAGITSLVSLRRISKASGLDNLYASENDKHRKEGLFYIVTPRGVRCQVCPNECHIYEGGSGDCRSRKNINGKLYSVAYGNPCAVHVDPVEKKPLYHFLPQSKAYSIAAAGCNLSCLNCQNWSISQKSPDETDNFDLMPANVVNEAISSHCRSIAYTYSEPVTFFEYTYDTSVIAKEKGIKNILVSAGYINDAPLRKLSKVIDAANIDLKSFDNNIYLKLNGGTLQPVLNTLKILHEEGVWLEITNLIIPGWTDDLEMIRKMCKWLVSNNLQCYPLHFSRFHPQYKLTQLPPTSVETLVKARNIALDEGIKFVYIGNVTGTEAENTYCPSCKKVIAERKGYKVNISGIRNNKCVYCTQEIPGIWN